MTSQTLRKSLKISAALAFLGATALPVHAYTIDGSLADWGVNTNTLLSSTAKSQATEDQHGNYLNPGYGGQKYDAEAMYLDWDANYLYVGVLTGLPENNPQNPAGNSYGPGDIIFNFGSDNTPDFALKVRTTGGLTKGKVYRPGSWMYGIWSAPDVLANSSHPPMDVVGIKTGTQVGTGNLAYSSGFTGFGQWKNDTHYFIEARIPTSAFGSFWAGNGPHVSLEVSWSALCGNDLIIADPAPAPASEPGMIGLLGLSMGSMAWLGRRNRASGRKRA